MFLYKIISASFKTKV